MTVSLGFLLRRFEWRVFWAVFLGTALYFIVARADFFFGPAIFEAGDDAANALQILRAKHGVETLGNYSRFGFHHPGPAFFYVYALGEIVFRDLLRVVASPGQAHVFAGVLLQSFFFAAAFRVIASHRQSVRLVLLAAAVGLVHFRLAERAFLSTWPPHQLLMPFLCLIVAASSVAVGRLRDLPLLVLASGFLIHGHISQPLFVGSIWLATGALFWHRTRATRARRSRFADLRPIWISVGIAAVFAVPLLVELARGRSGNFAPIVSHLLHYKGEYKTLNQSLYYFAQFFTYWPYQTEPSGDWHTFAVKNFATVAFWFVVVACGARLAILLQRAGSSSFSRREARFWTALGVMTSVAVAASIVWGVKMDGPMWSFNGFINYAIIFLLLIAPVLLIDLTSRLRTTRFPIPEAAALLAMVLLPSAHPVQMQELSKDFGMDNHAVRLLIGADRPAKRQLLWHSYTVWIQTPSLALGLARRGIDYGVRPEFTLLCGKDHLGDPAESLRNPRTNAAWLLGTKPELLASFDEVIDLGHGCFAQQWQKVRRIAPGTEIPLTNDRVFAGGFSGAEEGFRWTVGPRSCIFLPLASADREVTVRFKLHPLVDGRSKLVQRVRVSAATTPLTEWSVAGAGEFLAVIPAAVLQQQVDEFGGVVLNLDMPDACTPQSLGMNTDARLLAVGIHALNILE